MALAARRQDQVLASAVRHHGLRLAGCSDHPVCFDELTHFTAHQFFYMVSRNRSTCGVRPYIRATCNPDADSWVADFLAWWIDPQTGLPIPERAGVLRYYIRVAESWSGPIGPGN